MLRLCNIWCDVVHLVLNVPNYKTCWGRAFTPYFFQFLKVTDSCPRLSHSFFHWSVGGSSMLVCLPLCLSPSFQLALHYHLLLSSFTLVFFLTVISLILSHPNFWYILFLFHSPFNRQLSSGFSQSSSFFLHLPLTFPLFCPFCQSFYSPPSPLTSLTACIAIVLQRLQWQRLLTRFVVFHSLPLHPLAGLKTVSDLMRKLYSGMRSEGAERRGWEGGYRLQRVDRCSS